jgi:hypothetical protein
VKSLSIVRPEPIVLPDRSKRTIFICHGRNEAHFVPLLETLLDLHDHRATSALVDVDADENRERLVERIILESDVVLLVLGETSTVRPYFSST